MNNVLKTSAYSQAHAILVVCWKLCISRRFLRQTKVTFSIDIARCFYGRVPQISALLTRVTRLC